LAVALHEAFRAYQGLWFGWSGKVSAHPAYQVFPVLEATEEPGHCVLKA
jgi:hypothetical protein